MEYLDRLENTAVIGAGGKMGSGITLLMAQEMALRSLENPGRTFHLAAIDTSEAALDGLRAYVKSQVGKSAEKLVGKLRELYAGRPDLVENGEIIQEFVDLTVSMVRLSTDLGAAAKARWVFEAIVEDIDVKLKVYTALKAMNGEDTYYLTNTSSIPIGLIDEKVGLDGRLIGCHFYNPPAVQKLTELITSKRTRADLVDVSKKLASALKKTIVPANDVAGFIGNGHFIRDGLYAASRVKELTGILGSQTAALWAVNRVTQDLLVRPMGIFQLIDYVGIDVFQCILHVMGQFIKGETLQSDLIDGMMQKGVRGGQSSDGSQKNGFLSYEKGKVVGVYDFASGGYLPADKVSSTVDPWMGALPDNRPAWKALSADKAKADKLGKWFAALSQSQANGARMAVAYLKECKRIGKNLVADGVARTADDVNAVMLTGFFHLYGPINDHVS
jgi:3-hydroxyacyl-CoA dehydrogenase